jgi:hypothetical protein
VISQRFNRFWQLLLLTPVLIALAAFIVLPLLWLIGLWIDGDD